MSSDRRRTTHLVIVGAAPVVAALLVTALLSGGAAWFAALFALPVSWAAVAGTKHRWAEEEQDPRAR